MIGERVRLAREACRLTQQDLALASSTPLGTLGDIEAGRIANPNKQAIERIAQATTFPTSFFFLGPLPDLPEGYYRRLKRGTNKVAKQVRAQVRQIVEVVQRAEQMLDLPPVAIQPVREVSTPDDIEVCASTVRLALRVGERDPIPNITRAVERAGVVVVALPNEMEDHDGFSAWPDFGLDGRPVIATSRGHSGDRARLTVAHEVGHLVLHTLRGDTEPGTAEKEAFRFAGALLLPREAAEEALRSPVTLRTLKAVKATHGISMGGGAQRARDLGLITPRHFVSLRKQLSARGWNRVEPVEVPLETPLLIHKVLDLLAGEGGTTERAQRVSMPTFYFRAVSGA